MLSLRRLALRAPHQGCIALCNDSVWAAHAALQGGEQEQQNEQSSMRYATLAAATMACHHQRPFAIHGSFSNSHRTFFSWGSGTPPKPGATDAALDAAEPVATNPADMLDVSQIIDVASMAEMHALQAAGESAWPNTVVAQYLIELLHSSAGLGWCVLPLCPTNSLTVLLRVETLLALAVITRVAAIPLTLYSQRMAPKFKARMHIGDVSLVSSNPYRRSRRRSPH